MCACLFGNLAMPVQQEVEVEVSVQSQLCSAVMRAVVVVSSTGEVIVDRPVCIGSSSRSSRGSRGRWSSGSRGSSRFCRGSSGSGSSSESKGASSTRTSTSSISGVHTIRCCPGGNLYLRMFQLAVRPHFPI